MPALNACMIDGAPELYFYRFKRKIGSVYQYRDVIETRKTDKKGWKSLWKGH